MKKSLNLICPHVPCHVINDLNMLSKLTLKWDWDQKLEKIEIGGPKS